MQHYVSEMKAENCSEKWLINHLSLKRINDFISSESFYSNAIIHEALSNVETIDKPFAIVQDADVSKVNFDFIHPGLTKMQKSI